MLAQAVADPAALADDLVGTFLPIAMVLGPIVLAILMRFTSESDAKKYFAGLMAALVAVLSLVVDPPLEITIPIISARLMASWPLLQTAYLAYQAVASKIKPAGINELFRLGNFGIQLGRVEKAISETKGNVDDMLRG